MALYDPYEYGLAWKARTCQNYDYVSEANKKLTATVRLV